MNNFSDWIIPISSSFVTIIVTVMTCKWQLRTELRKISENYVSDKKYKAYYNAVNMFYSIMSEIKNKGAIVGPSDRFQEMLKVKEDLFVYGSDKAFRAFTEFLCNSSQNQPNQDYIEYFLNFMLIVRKEISGGKSKLTTDDILLNIMQSHEELRKYQVFCGFK